MQRSLFTAISGLNNHQTKLDVIGNNIANVNTTAYKSSSVKFADILSQTISGASAPQGNRGGVNPMQVGLGMQVAAITNNHTQGNLQSTGRLLDMAIQGEGFFLVNDGTQNYFSRDGSFTRGADGYLISSVNGFRVMGWASDQNGNIDTTQPLNALSIPLGFQSIAKATENQVFGGNLNASAIVNDNYALEMDVYDSLGNVHTMEIVFTKDGVNTWNWEAHVNVGGSVIGNGNGTIEFSPQGTVISGQTGNFTADFTGSPQEGADPLDITLDFNAFSQLVGNSDAELRLQDGFPMGLLDGFNISSTGVIVGSYTNGMVSPLGQIALGRVENAEGMTKIGNNIWQPSANAGQVYIGTPGTQGRGSIQTSTLEMSNVNLAFEFTEIITTSRAFQANSRVITSSDELLQEIVNLKR